MPKVIPAWLKEADSHIGYHEGPNNDTAFGAHYGLNHEPWCALFVSYCFEKSGHPLPVMQPGMRNGFAAVIYGMEYAKKHGCWRPSAQADPGDIIVYGWNGPGSSASEMHTGFVVSSGPVGSTGHTVEGNRADQVERATFIVGETVVLGTINTRKLLGLPKTRPPRKPAAVEPQHRSPHHPRNTGPRVPISSPKPRRPWWARFLHGWWAR